MTNFLAPHWEHPACVRCAGTCNKNIHLTDTSSMYRPNGTLHNIYCHDCYKAKENNNENRAK